MPTTLDTQVRIPGAVGLPGGAVMFPVWGTGENPGACRCHPYVPEELEHTLPLSGSQFLYL